MARFFLPIIVLAALFVSGCGGKNASVVLPPAPSSAPTTAPTPAPVPTATSTPANVPVGPTPSSVTLTGNGFTLSFIIPAVLSGGGSMTANLQTALPAGVLTPALTTRSVNDSRRQGAQLRSPGTLGFPLIPLVYLTVVPSADITFASAPSFVYTLPAGTTLMPGSSAYVAFYDPAASATGWVVLLGPGLVVAQTVTFPSVAANVALKGGTQYVYALVATNVATPTPGPTSAPSGSPTSAPSGAPTSAPSGSPSSAPSGTPSSAPSGSPSSAPSGAPSGAPSTSPSSVPTTAPTSAPSSAPTPVRTPSPTPTVAPTAPPAPGFCPAPSGTLFPMSFQNNTGIGGPITVYAYGLNPANSTQWVYLTSPTSGALAPLPGAGSQVPSFQLPANNCLYLPPLISARIYLVTAGQTINLASNGATSGVAAAYPWTVNAANAGTVSAVWDFLEYTWYGPPGAFGMDTTQVDAIGIPLSFQAVNASGSPAASPLYGMKPRAISNLVSDLNALGTPWTGLIQQTGTAGAPRVISPQHAANIPADSTTPGATPAPPPPPPPNSPTFSTNYYDAILAQIWSTYQGTRTLYLSYPGQISAAYGVVDPNTKLFNFYPTASASGTPIAQIAFPTTWAVLNNAGAFANASGSTPGGPNLATFIGRALVVSIERGTLPLPSGAPSKAQPFCGTTDWTLFYGGATTNGGTTPVSGFVTNWYSSLMHKYGQAPVGGLPGLAYAFPDDDECQLPGGSAGQYAPYWQQPYTPGEQWNVTLNPI